MYSSIDERTVYAYTGARAPRDGQPAIVFLHGAGLDHTVWSMQARYFAHHGFNAYALDLPGHGRSDGPPLASIGAMADWLARFVAQQGAGPAVIVGHSMGSLVALDISIRHAACVAGAVLAGTAAPMGVAAPLQDAADANDPVARDMITVWGHSMTGQVGGGPHAPGTWLPGASLRLLERAGPGVLGNDLRSCNSYASSQELAASIQCPVMLLLGERDMMTPPRASRELAVALPDCRTEIIAGCGHMLMGEQPDAVLDALVRFCGELKLP